MTLERISYLKDHYGQVHNEHLLNDPVKEARFIINSRGALYSEIRFRYHSKDSGSIIFLFKMYF